MEVILKMVNPIIAAILSFIIPGIGQIVAGETKRGLLKSLIRILSFSP
jgi:TM2 domain-containing membrane protein YozV